MYGKSFYNKAYLIFSHLSAWGTVPIVSVSTNTETSVFPDDESKISGSGRRVGCLSPAWRHARTLAHAAVRRTHTRRDCAVNTHATIQQLKELDVHDTSRVLLRFNLTIESIFRVLILLRFFWTRALNETTWKVILIGFNVGAKFKIIRYGR